MVLWPGRGSLGLTAVVAVKSAQVKSVKSASNARLSRDDLDRDPNAGEGRGVSVWAKLTLAAYSYNLWCGCVGSGGRGGRWEEGGGEGGSQIL